MRHNRLPGPAALGAQSVEIRALGSFPWLQPDACQSLRQWLTNTFAGNNSFSGDARSELAEGAFVLLQTIRRLLNNLTGQPTEVGPCALPPAEDTVYLEDEDQRTEYVLTQQGIIYQGSNDFIVSTPWNFGQVSLRLRAPALGCLSHGTRGPVCTLACSPGSFQPVAAGQWHMGITHDMHTMLNALGRAESGPAENTAR